jgi:hypothetical protein
MGTIVGGRSTSSSPCSWWSLDDAGRTAGVRARSLAAACAALLLAALPLASAAAHPRRTTVQGGFGPVWSPDGTRIAYIADPLIPRHVEVVRADGTGPARTIATAPRQQGLVEVRWAANGRLVYEDDNYTLWSAWPGATPVRLAFAGSLDQAFSLSADGRRVAITAPCACEIRQGTGVSVVAARGGAVLHVRRAAQEADFDPAFAPDGRRLVFSRIMVEPHAQHPVHETLVEEGVRGGWQRSLRVIGDHAAFSQDGRWLGFFAPAGLEAMRATGGRPRLLRRALHPGDESSFAWSHDSSSLVYVIRRTIGTVSLAGRRTTFAIPGLRPSGDTPQWSPDDSSIAFTAGTGSPDERVYVIGADGSALRRIA